VIEGKISLAKKVFFDFVMVLMQKERIEVGREIEV